MKKTFLLLSFVLLIVVVNGQNPASGLVIGVKGGTSKMMSEGSSLFSGRVNEFDQNAGMAVDLEISKPFWNHFEVGIDLGIANLGGTLEEPILSTSKYKIDGDNFIYNLEAPVEYTNQLISQKFFVGYYFRSFSNINKTLSPEPFIRAGIGYISYGVELFENGQSIWGKGTPDYPDIGMSTTLFFAAAGVKSYISPNFFMNFTYCINYTNYDYLDAVFNYDSSEQRLGYNGLYSELKIGLFYQFAGKEKRGGSPKNGLGPNLPFSR